MGTAALDSAAVGFADRLRHHLRGREPGTVAGYLAMGGELDPAPALRSLHRAGWRIVLPRIGPGFTMAFARWEPGRSLLTRNRFGIDEPDGPAIDPAELDVVVTPGIAFDARGGRIGHGAGFYDRFFALVDELGTRPDRIGAAHDFQVVELVPMEPWDVPMDLVITPTRIIFATAGPMVDP